MQGPRAHPLPRANLAAILHAMNKVHGALALMVALCTGFSAACGSTTAPSATPVVTADGGATADAGATLTTTSWYANGKPFVDRYCRSCHGGAGPGTGDFTSYENVVALAQPMLAAVTAGRMPPGASDPKCRDYANSDRRFVSDADRESFAKWVAEGTPKGEPKGEAEVPPLDETIANPDLVIKAAAAYAPTFSNPNEPGNEYRCFALKPGLTGNKFITEMGPVLDKRSMIHHIVAYRIAEPNLPAAGKNFPAEGWSCIDMVNAGINPTNPFQGDGMIVAWAPGTGAFKFPAGTGLSLKSTDAVVLQIHYFQSGKEPAGTKDQTGFAFKFADSVQTPLLIAPVGKSGFRIPAGNASYSYTGSFGPLPVSLKVYGTMPHMHVLGTGYELSVSNGSNPSTCIAKSDRYDFSNQVTYFFKEPVLVPAGAKVDFRCTWDNSAANPNQFNDPPVDVSYGERTDQEMCYAFSILAL
jgi:cytochrome c5